MHSLLVSHRIFNDLWLFRRIGLAGTGMENFRWRRPVYPGDTVRVRGRVAGIEPKSGERAVLTMEIEMLNQDDVIVLRYDLNILVRTDR
jgi:acyl dehydratase